ncbi:ATP-binding protein [Streptomyces sp. NBC_00191]|uniref:ATP-binding protein n=1 Tax=Streptomyces sp. NBC_00191 TaxID=2975674 RepID=UPI0038660E58
MGKPTPETVHGVPSPTQHLPLPGDGASALFQVINQRYLKSSTILTTNVGIADWAGAFGDATVAAAMLDRLLHRAAVVGIDGPSYRLRSHQAHSEQPPQRGDWTCWLNSATARSAGPSSTSPPRQPLDIPTARPAAKQKQPAVGGGNATRPLPQQKPKRSTR